MKALEVRRSPARFGVGQVAPGDISPFAKLAEAHAGPQAGRFQPPPDLAQEGLVICHR